MISPRAAYGVAIVRMLTGVIFVAEGASKIFGEFVRGGFAKSVREVAAEAWPMWASFLRSVVLPNARPFGWFFALAELALGIGLLLGLLTRVASVCGVILMTLLLLGQTRVPGGSWETWDGTSMAAPHVAGIAGLVLSQNPLFTTAQMKNAVMHGVDKPATLHTMFIAPVNTQKTGAFTRTSGRVNALAALTASTANATPVTDGNVDHAASWSTNKKSGSVAWPSDVNDVFKRKLSSGHTYRFTLVVPSGKDYDLWVWKPGTKEIWQFDSTNRLQKFSVHGNGRDEVVQFTAKKTGTYYVQVSAWLFKAGSYALKFERVS